MQPLHPPRIVLRAAGVSQEFARRTVFSSVDLDVRAGEVAVVVGENGCGKTTLLRTLGADLSPTTGVVELCRSSGRHAVHYAANTWPLGAKIVGEIALKYACDTHAARAALDRFALCPAQQIATLSTGERQRLSLAVASLRSAWLYLFDGPTTGLDSDGWDLAEALIHELTDGRAGVVIATNDVELLVRLGRSSLLRLCDGNLEVVRSGDRVSG